MARSTHHAGYQVFIALLRDMRTRAGVSQLTLAERLDNTQTFISKFERGERRVDAVEFVEICEALGQDPLHAFREYLARRRDQAEHVGIKLARTKRSR